MTGPTKHQETFRCAACGACCRWAGFVRVRSADIDAAARLLGISVDAFIARFTRLAHDRQSLVLTDRPDGACIFLDAANRCRIHAAKPRQCRDFPERWSVPGLEHVCQAMRDADAVKR